MNEPRSHILTMIMQQASILQKAFGETLWPSRCVICDMPGDLICQNCRINLPYLDQLRACPRCGAAYGKEICTECNRFILDWKKLTTFPLDSCVSATILTPMTKRIITAYKDRGEQRLSNEIACIMAEVIPPSWEKESLLIPIPASAPAKKRRGFDHMQLIIDQLFKITEIPVLNALEANRAKDQRVLDGQERLVNMKGSFRLKQDASTKLTACRQIIIVDDVMTTGATLFSAAETIRLVTRVPVLGLTFTRVP